MSITDDPQADLLLMKKLIQLSNDPFVGVSLSGDDPARLLGWKRERDEARTERDALKGELADAMIAFQGTAARYERVADERDALRAALVDATARWLATQQELTAMRSRWIASAHNRPSCIDA